MNDAPRRTPPGSEGSRGGRPDRAKEEADLPRRERDHEDEGEEADAPRRGGSRDRGGDAEQG